MSQRGVATIEIQGRRIGGEQPVYVIAEISANHNQSFEDAVRLVRAAADAGADAVKLQTYTPDTITIDCDNRYFRIEGTIWEGRNLYQLYGEAYTPWEWQGELKAVAEGRGLHCFSSPFDATAVDFLEELDVPAYKIASFENVDLPLLRRVAATGKPVIVSTGMASLAEIDEAVGTLRAAGAEQVALLKCTSAYPAMPEGMNLRTIPHLGDAFRVPVGLSDHTLGTAVPVAAVALGAAIIEKHITLSREVPGPDSAFSLEPGEFRAMVDAVRMAQPALGQVHYGLSPSEEKSRAFRRSLFVVRDIEAGEELTAANIRSIRPGFGLPPKYLDEVLGKRALRAIARGTPLSWDLVGG
jgi:pseudaminic acid synthase